MRILKHILIMSCFLMPGFFASAQTQREKIEELRAAFLSKKLEFSKEESEKFWPVYNEYQDKLLALKKQVRQAYRKLPANYDEKEAEELLALENKSKLAEAELAKLYNDKLKALIGAKKMVKLHLAEEEFKREVINTIKEKQ